MSQRPLNRKGNVLLIGRYVKYGELGLVVGHRVHRTDIRTSLSSRKYKVNVWDT